MEEKNMSLIEFKGIMNGRVKTEEYSEERDFFRIAEMEEDMEREFKVRSQASEKLGMVESFHFPMGEEPAAAAALAKTAQGETKEISTQEKDYDGYGNVIICKLSEKRKVAVQNFKGKALVSIREYHEKDGKQFPCPKGISLTTEQWEVFKTAVPAIEEALKKMQSQMG